MVAPNHQQGFALVETLCAFAIASILAVALVHTGHGKAQSINRAYQETIALRIAQAEIEATRTDVGRQRIGEHIIALPANSADLAEGTGTRTVREILPQLFDVEVEVRWRPPGAQQSRSVQLTTRFAREGVGK